MLESREAKNPRLSSGNEAGLDKRKGLIESILLAAAASVFFIAWGVYANWEHGLGAIVQVAVTQGVISFSSTFLSAELLQRMYGALRRARMPGILNVLFGILIINGTVACAHWMAGTPEIWMTMLPGAVISLFFCSGYTYRLRLAWSTRDTRAI